MTSSPPSCRLLLISGSLRDGSTNTAALRTAAAVAPPGTTAPLYEGLDRLPHYNPDHDTEPLDPTVAQLRAEVARADALVVSVPEYAGALPGSFKNLLDWLVGSTHTAGIPVAWINVSTAPTAAASAHASLRTVLGWIGVEIVDAACRHIPVPRSAIDPDGTITDAPVRAEIAAAIETLVEQLAERSVPTP